MAARCTEIPIYGIKLIVARSRRDYLSARSKHAPSGDYDDWASNKDNSGLTELLVSGEGKPATLLIGVFSGGLSTLVHEVGHGAFKVLRYVGIPCREENSEAYCYLMDWLFTEARKRG